jgi:hypothetical protein
VLAERRDRPHGSACRSLSAVRRCGAPSRGPSWGSWRWRLSCTAPACVMSASRPRPRRTPRSAAPRRTTTPDTPGRTGYSRRSRPHRRTFPRSAVTVAAWLRTCRRQPPPCRWPTSTRRRCRCRRRRSSANPPLTPDRNLLPPAPPTFSRPSDIPLLPE